MNKVSAVLAALALLFSAAVAQEAQQPGQAEGEQAMLRVAHLAAGAPTVRISINGQQDQQEQTDQEQATQEQADQVHAGELESLSFRDVSNYQSVPAGSLTIEIYAEGQEGQAEGQTEGQATGQPIFTGLLELEAGRYYTLVALREAADDMTAAATQATQPQQQAAQEQATEEQAAEEQASEEQETQEQATQEQATQEQDAQEQMEPTAEGLRFELFQDEVTEAPGEGEALARFVHAHHGTGEVDIAAVGSNVVVQGLGYGGVSEYFIVPDGVSLEVRMADEMNEAAQQATQEQATQQQEQATEEQEAREDEVEEEEVEETTQEQEQQVQETQQERQAVAELAANELQAGFIYTVFITETEQGEPDLLVVQDMIDPALQDAQAEDAEPTEQPADTEDTETEDTEEALEPDDTENEDTEDEDEEAGGTN